MTNWQKLATLSMGMAIGLWAQFPPFGGPGGGPPGMMQNRKLVKEFDTDGDKRLNAKERAAAREKLASEPKRPRFGPRFQQEDETPPAPGPRLDPSRVKKYKQEPLYDPAALRTIFIEFENKDWEKELADFNNTDVDVRARVTVDGKVYPDVGVHFRGMSSYMMVSEGHKRSLNLSFDFVNKEHKSVLRPLCVDVLPGPLAKTLDR